jgi:hypothetical protein
MNVNRHLDAKNHLPAYCSLACYTAETVLCNCKCRGKYHAAEVLPYIIACPPDGTLPPKQARQLFARNHTTVFTPPLKKKDLYEQKLLPIIDAVDYI